MGNARYTDVYSYVIEAECKTPMHVGGASGDPSEVLIHPTDDMPFIQATGIAGVLREYTEAEYSKEIGEYLFGRNTGDGGNDRKSRLIVTDGVFQEGCVKTELRPRIKIGKETGCVSEERIMGDFRKSGQKMEMEYVSVGSKFTFGLYLMWDQSETKADSNPSLVQERDMQGDKNEKWTWEEPPFEVTESLIAALGNGSILIGGQNTNGCGQIGLIKVHKKHFDMKKEADLRCWAAEEADKTDGYEDITRSVQSRRDKIRDYVFELTAAADCSLLVKGIAVDAEKAEKILNIQDLDGMPDSMNLLNGNGEYIIPGSSLKGVFRSRIEMIAGYRNIAKEALVQIFENRSCLSFYDSVIKNASSVEQYRIRIDKFTGGVMDKALFSELPVAGEVTIMIRAKKKKDMTDTEFEQCLGFLLMAIRDLAIGAMNIGSGGSIGRGFLKVKTLRVSDGAQDRIKIDCEKGQCAKGAETVSAWLKAVGKGA